MPVSADVKFTAVSYRETDMLSDGVTDSGVWDSAKWLIDVRSLEARRSLCGGSNGDVISQLQSSSGRHVACVPSTEQIIWLSLIRTFHSLIQFDLCIRDMEYGQRLNIRSSSLDSSMLGPNCLNRTNKQVIKLQIRGLVFTRIKSLARLSSAILYFYRWRSIKCCIFTIKRRNPQTLHKCVLHTHLKFDRTLIIFGSKQEPKYDETHGLQ